MMKDFKTWIIAGSLLLTACGDNALTPLPDGAEPDVLRVLSVDAAEPDTRSIVTTAGLNTAGGRIGVYAVNTDGTEYVPSRGGSNTSAYQHDGNRWNCDATDGSKLLRLPPTGSTVKAAAFYPADLVPRYGSNGGSYVSGIHVLAADDFTATNQTDYLYSGFTGTLHTASRNTSFTLKHALAKLTIKVYRKSVLSDTKLTSLQILDAGGSNLQAGSGKSMNLETGALQGLVGQTAITLTAGDDGQKQTISEAGSSTTATAYTLVAPAPSLEYLAFQLTTSRGTAESEQSFLTSSIKMVDASPASGEYLRWTAGSHYVFTIVLDGMQAGIADIQVCKWESDTDTFIPVS